MAHLVAQAALGSTFSTLFPKLLDVLKNQELCNFWGVRKMLKGLEKQLLRIQGVLQDAEARILDKRVENWVDDLRELAYDMDDILDEMNIERLQLEQAARKEANNTPVRNFFFKFLKGAKKFPLYVTFNTKLKSKIKEVLSRLNEVSKAAHDLGLKSEIGGTTGMPHQVRLRPDIGPFVDESEVYGREKDKENIIDLLLASTSSSKKSYSVISVVGMGGIGKTTLAKHVFQDKKIEEYFTLRSWSCVSDIFDITKVTRDLVEFVGKENPGTTIGTLQRSLQDLVRDKRCLLVLDDVWRAKEWDELVAPLSCCANGSKILVTTRNRKTVNGITYELGNLEDEACWNLFKEKAFQGVDSYTNGNMENMGKEIVKRCKGVPLAVKVLGAILQGAPEEKWESLLRCEIWRTLDGDDDEIFPALRMSYHYLPSHLKRCFEYLSLFPTDYRFNKGNLARMWIAEGLIEAKEGRLLEDIAREYYDEMKRRSLIQKDDRMHDLVHSLACLVSKKFYYQVQNGIISHKMESIRHASFLDKQVKVTDLDLLLQAKSLRTLLFHYDHESLFDSHALSERLSKWSLLRVLNIHLANTVELPSCTGNLKHLRYLKIFGNTKMQILPHSVCELYNLQTLDLHCCKSLNILPKDIENLRSLEYLDLSSTSVSTLPSSICKLTNLKKLKLNYCRLLSYLPEDIGDLRNLKELLLGYSQISSLPESIGKLHKLQVLNLENCVRLTHLPKDVGNLESLKRLSVEQTSLSLPDSIVKITCLQALGNRCDLDFWHRNHCEVKLPPHIGKLTNLESLYEYNVGKETGRGIGELKDMNNLRGSLVISHLENVESVEEASMADLKGKKHINELTFQWSPFLPEIYDNGSSSSVVRDGDVELKVLEALEPHSTTITSLYFRNYNGDMFPKWMFVASFSSLKCLKIVGMHKIRRMVGLELLSLMELDIISCLSLKDVSMVPPKLTQLIVKDCQELTELFLLPSLQDNDSNPNSSWRIDLPQLKQLDLWECPNLRQISMAVPMLKELRMKECKALDIILPLRLLEADDCQDDSHSNFTSRIHLSHLEKIGIWNCPSLRCVSMSVPMLKELGVEECEKLNISLTLVSCIEDLCLASLNITSFRDLMIAEENCDQIASIAMNGPLPPTLRKLFIADCHQLESLFEDGQQLPELQYLRIFRCEQLRLLAIDAPPLPNLRHLRIENCSRLESVWKHGGVLGSLESLTIRDCPELKSIPLGPCLKKLLSNYSSVLPLPWLRNLTSLKELHIEDLPTASFLFDNHDAFPPSLTTLRIYNCIDVSSLKALHNLTSITSLTLDNCNQLVTFPEGNESLPPMLTCLKFSYCTQLVSLREEGLPPALTELSVWSCPNLTSLPKTLHNLASLRLLQIYSCPELEARPDDRLPPNLQHLDIYDCPKLEQQLEEEDRRDWLHLMRRGSHAMTTPVEVIMVW